MKPIKVLIDARLPDKGAGGVQQVVISLAEGFKNSDPFEFERTWLVYRGTTWWRHHFPLSDHVKEVRIPGGKISLVLGKNIPTLASQFKPLFDKLFQFFQKFQSRTLNKSFDLYHAPFQDALQLRIPTIYHPHDLQHMYFPENFSKHQLKHRNEKWKKNCSYARIIIVEAKHVAEDLYKFWSINGNKIITLPTPPFINSDVNQNVPLEGKKNFAIYPAAFWPHKNHLNLVKAWKILDEMGEDINLILCGAINSQFVKVKNLVTELGLEKKITVLSHIPEKELLKLYQESKLLIMPSKFESISLPVWECFLLGTPVAASRISGVQEQVEGFGELFNPDSPQEIANAVLTLISNNEKTSLRVAKSFNKVIGLGSSTFALAMQRVYKMALGITPSELELNEFDKLNNYAV